MSSVRFSHKIDDYETVCAITCWRKLVNFFYLVNLIRNISHFTGFGFQNINYYEAVDYDVGNIHQQHLSAMDFPHKFVIINFSAFQRYVSDEISLPGPTISVGATNLLLMYCKIQRVLTHFL